MKDCYLKLRCTEKEKRIIKCLAEQNGMNMSEYILSLVFKQYLTNLDKFGIVRGN